MFNSVLHNYPNSLDDTQQRAYISVLLQIADVDGISDGELGLIKEMAKKVGPPYTLAKNPNKVKISLGRELELKSAPGKTWNVSNK